MARKRKKNEGGPDFVERTVIWGFAILLFLFVVLRLTGVTAYSGGCCGLDLGL